MIDTDRVLGPLDEERDAIERLATYASPTELSDALRRAWTAVERVFRQLLRNDPEAPDELRLSALSPADLPYDRLIPALSRRNLISLRLAGMAHQMEQSARRAETESPRAADADLALATVYQLRSEVGAHGHRATAQRPVGAAEATVLDEAVHAVPPDIGGSAKRGLLVGAIVLALALLVVLVVRGGGAMADATAAFEAGQLAIAERGFRQASAEDPENVDALLYLGRIYRRQGRFDEAATVLQEAANAAPQDQHVRRELGYLFMDLGRPAAAAQQFRRAQEIDPENPRNWIGLIRALREAGDPEADAVLQRAPTEVRASLSSTLLPPDTI